MTSKRPGQHPGPFHFVTWLDAANLGPLDYYIFPSLDMNLPHLKLSENNHIYLDAYRFGSLDFLYSLAQQCSFGEAA